MTLKMPNSRSVRAVDNFTLPPPVNEPLIFATPDKVHEHMYGEKFLSAGGASECDQGRG